MVNEWVKYIMTACYLVNELNTMALQKTRSNYTFLRNYYKAHLIFRPA